MATELLTTGEFNRAMDRLHGRLNEDRDRVDYCIAEVASVKTLINERAPRDKKQARNVASGWSAAVAGLIVIVVKAIELWANAGQPGPK